MLTLQNRLCPNEAEVAAKVLDGEAIIINLSNGMYYSMDKVGGLLWEMIADEYSLAEIVAAIVARYDVSPKQAHADVERLAQELIQENLVMVSDGSPPPRENQEIQSQQRLTYESPRLSIYRDMGDLLALDPPMPTLEEIVWKEPTAGSSG
jgi:hypothetical protein